MIAKDLTLFKARETLAAVRKSGVIPLFHKGGVKGSD